MNVRPETAADREAIRAVNVAAFETAAEADLVDALREGVPAEDLVSLVAEDGGDVVGHILFSPVTLAGHPEISLAGLGPMAVLPERQRSGIGSALVREGLEVSRRRGARAVVVLGHPAYYPRFGFEPASRHGIDSDWDVPDDVFLVLELEPGSLDGRGGRAKYHPAFDAV